MRHLRREERGSAVPGRGPADSRAGASVEPPGRARHPHDAEAARRTSARRSARPGEATIEVARIDSADAPYDLVKTMRASVLVLGPLLARRGTVRVSLPGGCAIGVRPIDLHLAAFEKLGRRGQARTRLRRGARQEAHGRRDHLRHGHGHRHGERHAGGDPRAAARRVLENAAREPEVVDLARMLDPMGARIGAPGRPRSSRGSEELHAAAHTSSPTGSRRAPTLAAGAITRRRRRRSSAAARALEALTDAARRRGLRVEAIARHSAVRAPKAASPRTTSPRPPTPASRRTCRRSGWRCASGMDGVATITETIFENRFQHVAELVRMGARITARGPPRPSWTGPPALTGAT